VEAGALAPLGMNILRQFRLYIAYREKKLYIGR
jgi:hypothetical protein